MLKIQVKVIPKSSLNKVISVETDDAQQIILKLKVTAPAVNGEANQALINLLSSHFSIKKVNIKILSGHTSKQKVIIIHNTDKSALFENTQLKLI